jgi:hypothetical protein
VRTSLILLLVSLAGVLGGGALIGLPALGACLIFDSLCVGYWTIYLHDDGTGQRPQVRGAPTLPQVLERYRDAA